MKPLSSAIAAALILFSAQGVAEQTTQPVVTSCANVVVVPPSQEHPPFDLNHMGTGSDKSDLYRFTPPQAKYIDIQPGHNEHRT
ncbi:multiple antibiotic resistance protein MarB [Escherichia coli]|uniref:multiple antibiotic resistance protein MarB n=1 Tax=Escherichia coli TaxID=562 RepID=UPI00112F6873|nr:multiple antibiotic resistance protein MarB [Escherichia coli]